MEFLEKYKLIRDSQHGFRKGRSCVTNLLLFLDRILRSVDEGFYVDVVFLDMAKAFDIIHQNCSQCLKWSARAQLWAIAQKEAIRGWSGEGVFLILSNGEFWYTFHTVLHSQLV